MRFLGKVRDVYTHGHHRSVVSQHAMRTVDNSAGFLLRANILDPATTKLLDVGCGPGSISAGFGPLCKEVIAVDAEASVLEDARKAVDSAGVSNVHIQKASAYSLPFESGTFHVVYAHQVLQHLAEPVQAISEMRRVLKPGGLLAVRDADYSSMLVHPALAGINLWRDVYRATCKRNGAEPDAGRFLVKWMLDAGFERTQLDLDFSVVPYASSEACRSWGSAWEQRALKSAFSTQAVEYGLATRSDLEYISQSWAEWSKAPDACFYYCNGEILASKG
mmetsp:Transcript_9162/g.16079  ORF Transcript_9162/g.16079 Transcript_9162/m.16079 type:complete len:277 (-) Transcript_9162:269-1099(-)